MYLKSTSYLTGEEHFLTFHIRKQINGHFVELILRKTPPSLDKLYIGGRQLSKKLTTREVDNSSGIAVKPIYFYKD